jgi:L-rhamnose isomerase
MKKEIIEKSYKLAKEQYAALGVDTDQVISDMDNINMMWVVSKKQDLYLVEVVFRLPVTFQGNQRL